MERGSSATLGTLLSAFIFHKYGKCRGGDSCPCVDVRKSGLGTIGRKNVHPNMTTFAHVEEIGDLHTRTLSIEEPIAAEAGRIHME